MVYGKFDAVCPLCGKSYSDYLEVIACMLTHVGRSVQNRKNETSEEKPVAKATRPETKAEKPIAKKEEPKPEPKPEPKSESKKSPAAETKKEDKYCCKSKENPSISILELKKENRELESSILETFKHLKSLCELYNKNADSIANGDFSKEKVTYSVQLNQSRNMTSVLEDPDYDTTKYFNRLGSRYFDKYFF